jgi:hypothetical protein
MEYAYLDEAILAVSLEFSDDEVASLEAPYRAHPVKGLAPPAPSLFGTRR